jgi:hypothetical protein
MRKSLRKSWISSDVFIELIVSRGSGVRIRDIIVVSLSVALNLLDWWLARIRGGKTKWRIHGPYESPKARQKRLPRNPLAPEQITTDKCEEIHEKS